jgi:transposase
MRVKFNQKYVKKLPSLQKEARFTGNIVFFRRTTAILMLSQSMKRQDIARSLGVCREVIGRWLALFLAKGPSGLRSKKSPGRPARLTKAQKKQLKAQIQVGPQEHGYPGGVWTSAMIQEHIQKNYGVFYSVKYVAELLRNMGLRHIKPKYTFSLSEENLKSQIKWVRKTFPDLCKQVKEVDGVLLFEDETTCQMQPNVMATWAMRGNPPTEEKNPKRGQIRVLGTIELWTGQLLYSIFESKKQDNGKYQKMDNGIFTKFIKQIANHYKGREIFIVLDGASYHGGAKIRDFLSRHPNIHLIRQPVKSPNLNPIEKVWKELKKDRTRNVYFRDKAALKSALRKGLFALQQNPRRIQSLMKKWEQVVSNPKEAFEGKYDSSLVPKKYKDSIQNIRQKISNELRKIQSS